jgi:hypothetical protein
VSELKILRGKGLYRFKLLPEYVSEMEMYLLRKRKREKEEKKIIPSYIINPYTSRQDKPLSDSIEEKLKEENALCIIGLNDDRPGQNALEITDYIHI